MINNSIFKKFVAGGGNNPLIASNDIEMEELLVAENDGKIVKFTGNTSEQGYIENQNYIIKNEESFDIIKEGDYVEKLYFNPEAEVDLSVFPLDPDFGAYAFLLYENTGIQYGPFELEGELVDVIWEVSHNTFIYFSKDVVLDGVTYKKGFIDSFEVNSTIDFVSEEQDIWGKYISKTPFPKGEVVAKPIYILNELENELTSEDLLTGKSAYTSKGEPVHGSALGVLPNPVLDNPATASDIMFGKKAYDNFGNVIVGTKNPPFEVVFLWSDNGDNTITITGLTEYGKTLSEIEIPESYNGMNIISIGYAAFDSCYLLASITLPNSVISIGSSAFSGCTSLTSITLPNTLTSIEDNMFKYCTLLTNITIPNTLTSIGSNVFYECNGLTSITIPNTVTSIADLAFCQCISLTSITYEDTMGKWLTVQKFRLCINVPATVVHCTDGDTPIPDNLTYEDDVFLYSTTNLYNENYKYGIIIITGLTEYGKTLSEIEIPESYSWTNILVIFNEVFRNCTSLTKIIIPNTIIQINELAFRDCTSLTNVTLSNTLKVMKDQAFAFCSALESIILPNTLISIGAQAFIMCNNLTDIIYDGTIEEWSNIEKGIYWSKYVPATVVHCTDGDTPI